MLFQNKEGEFGCYFKAKGGEVLQVSFAALGKVEVKVMVL